MHFLEPLLLLDICLQSQTRRNANLNVQQISEHTVFEFEPCFFIYLVVLYNTRKLRSTVLLFIYALVLVVYCT